MNKDIPQINFLLKEVEIYHKRPILTTTDFEALSTIIEHEINEYISASTLKRLWGYVSDKHKPRVYTLNVLAKYIGYESFQQFCDKLIDEKAINSQFFNTKQVLSSQLTIEINLEIGWSPNRYLLLQYLGEDYFKVVESRNSKLIEGDIFTANNFMLNFPLFLPYVIRGDEKLPSFMAGQNGGLTVLNVLTNF
ncbi:MAG: hypothetical protein R3Y50_05290 [Rikenellaceae bacterium]